MRRYEVSLTFQAEAGSPSQLIKKAADALREKIPDIDFTDVAAQPAGKITYNQDQFRKDFT